MDNGGEPGRIHLFVGSDADYASETMGFVPDPQHLSHGKGWLTRMREDGVHVYVGETERTVSGVLCTSLEKGDTTFGERNHGGVVKGKRVIAICEALIQALWFRPAFQIMQWKGSRLVVELGCCGGSPFAVQMMEEANAYGVGSQLLILTFDLPRIWKVRTSLLVVGQGVPGERNAEIYSGPAPRAQAAALGGATTTTTYSDLADMINQGEEGIVFGGPHRDTNSFECRLHPHDGPLAHGLAWPFVGVPTGSTVAKWCSIRTSGVRQVDAVTSDNPWGRLKWAPGLAPTPAERASAAGLYDSASEDEDVVEEVDAFTLLASWSECSGVKFSVRELREKFMETRECSSEAEELASLLVEAVDISVQEQEVLEYIIQAAEMCGADLGSLRSRVEMMKQKGP
jgi:hypothetical protein